MDNDKLLEDSVENKFNPWDYVRVVNVRGDTEYQATEDEKIIAAHRGNPILGNKHPMKTPSMRERDRVISEYKKDLEADLAVQGSMYQLLKEIAQDIVDNKQKIALSCFCLPCNCHANLLVPVVVKFAEEILVNKNTQNNKFKI